MGPDLTKAYSKLGPQGLNSALETLFFPGHDPSLPFPMTPLFAYHPLTDDERRNLAAFLQDVDRQQPGTPTWAIAAIALAIVLMLIAVTGIAGRHRIQSVRRALLERVRVQTVAKI